MDNKTKTTDSIISDAVKEGIDFSEKEENSSPSPESQTKVDALKDSSSKSVEKTETSKSPAAEKSVEDQFQESKLPAHLFPRFKELYAEKKALAEQLKAKEALLNDPRIARLLSQKQQQEEELSNEPNKPQFSQGEITEEQRAALSQLKSLLGLDQYEQVIASLKKQNEELSRREENKAFDAEEADLKKLSSDHGLDYDNEVYPELTAWLQANPQYQGLGPGSLKFAFNNIYFSKMGELAERKKNLEMIEEQKKLKQSNVEAPSKSEKGKVAKTFKDEDDMIASLIKDAGGAENIDWNA